LLLNNLPIIFGCSGTRLTSWEADFFREIQPVGFILFGRNCETPEQILSLTGELQNCVQSENPLILIDQEGGRVARLKPPYWREAPPAEVFARLAEKDIEQAKEAVYLNSILIASELYDLGITVNCSPLLDIPTENSHNIIGDRAFGNNPEIISELAFFTCEGLMDGGILPVIKHIPGHGRAMADSHLELPIVDTSLEELINTDFVPFKKLNNMPLAMTAHILYSDIDNQVATFSPKVIDIIRNEIGFNGVLMSDDLSMKALGGSFGERAVKTIEAGCDIVLHCNGEQLEMEEIANSISFISEKSNARLDDANSYFQIPKSMDIELAEEKLEELFKCQ